MSRKCFSSFLSAPSATLRENPLLLSRAESQRARRKTEPFHSNPRPWPISAWKKEPGEVKLRPMSSRFHKSPRTESPLMKRRRFLKLSALTASSLAFWRRSVMAGPFTRESFEHLVPADKKLSPDWVKSLFARGRREVLRGDELKYVGMPIGG